MNAIRFDAQETTFLLDATTGQPPRILHWGAALPTSVSANEVAKLTARPGGPGNPDYAIAPSLAMDPGLGLLGPTGFAAHREGRDWGSKFVVYDVAHSDNTATIRTHDVLTQLQLDYQIALDPESGILSLSSSITNHGDGILDIVDMATAFLPIPAHMDQLIGFSGRWTGEFQRERLDRFIGGYIRENRRGRTSHDSFPAVIMCNAATTENAGEAYGIHLAWSGNHRVRVDTLNDGSVFASMGALLFPGEIRLAAGESYNSPPILASYSAQGLSAMSRQFHIHVREKLLRPATRNRPRPVHYNSWEAVYFDHDFNTLTAIADKAAAIGAERFVLDDGWFGARRDDTAGLGDWSVSKDVYPDGLNPLINHVRSLGMEFGLWFEPEMINPDSDLYRAHPDWVLGIEGIEQIPFRNQYVLDISRPEVADYLFTSIDSILSEYDIAYIKWDMNRDLNHPGNAQGQAVGQAQVTALYALLARMRAAHPGVEIETCASGGGRPDLGILAHTDRIWTSDTNDAIDRQSIQRGASYFLPLDVLGAHVGPSHCHQTGRQINMAMRAGTALFGHMGMELNLLAEPEADLAILKAAIQLHKDHRHLLHHGDFYRIDTPECLNAIGVVSRDKAQALFSVAMVKGYASTLPCRIRLIGLDANQRYALKLVWPLSWHPKNPPEAHDVPDFTVGTEANGEVLMKVGFQLPTAQPETVFLYHLIAVT
jgi:alpha-galactosidase